MSRAKTASSVGAAASFVAVLSAGAISLWAIRDPAGVSAAVVEDGPVEWATALSFLLATIAFALAARARRFPPSDGAPVSRFHLVLAALAAFGCCGEELSWGQRIFGFATPHPLIVINQQHEFNVHNVGRLQQLKYTLLVAVVAIGGLGIPIAGLMEPMRRLLRLVRVPAIPLVHCGWFLAAYFFLRHAANLIDFRLRNDAQEVGELYFALGVAAWSLHALASPPAAGPASRGT